MLSSRSNAYMLQQRVTERQYTNTRTRIAECSSLKLSRFSVNEKTNYEEECNTIAAKRMREGASDRRVVLFCSLVVTATQLSYMNP